jgi:oligopeptide transport system substrate-binding protein
MPHFFRRAFPLIALALLLAALAWAMSFGTLPPADFTFHNGDEAETIDPALATGQPENRIINGLFEGLLRNLPEPGWEQIAAAGRTVPLKAQAGISERYEISDDGKTYTFHIRRDAKWTDGTEMTAQDFAWSWMRMLHPETASRYAYQLHYVVGAKAYNLAEVEPGGRVEVELSNRPPQPNPLQPFPRGEILRGVLQSIHRPPEPALPESASDKQKEDANAEWKAVWLYCVQHSGHERWFSKQPDAAKMVLAALRPSAPQQIAGRIEKCLHVLPDFEATVGVRAENPHKLVVTLKHRTPYFQELVAFYPLYAVNRACVEKHGSPDWTRPENIVTNGAFKLQFRRIRDRIRVVKNPDYWDAQGVQLESVDYLAMKSETTGLNMYLNGQIDWAPYVPQSTIPILSDPQGEFTGQYYSAPMLTVYFYRINVTRPELQDKRVRQALNLAINKQVICDLMTRAGEVPATALVPPGIAGYESPPGPGYNVERARQLLADAGYAGGRGLPTIEILYNDLDAHRTIAETIQQMWRNDLGVAAELRGLEWGVYLNSQHNLDYEVSRAGWIADYADPNTFLDLFVTGGENNQTGWSKPRYDELIQQAAQEPDAARRMQILRDAEAILLDEQPIIPIYFYVSKHLVQRHVKGFFSTVNDEHPLKLLRIEK